MAKFRLNPFLVFSIVCILILVAYFWFVYLPFFEGVTEYDAIRFRVTVVTIFLLAAIAPILLLMKTGK